MNITDYIHAAVTLWKTTRYTLAVPNLSSSVYFVSSIAPQCGWGCSGPEEFRHRMNWTRWSCFAGRSSSPLPLPPLPCSWSKRASEGYVFKIEHLTAAWMALLFRCHMCVPKEIMLFDLKAPTQKENQQPTELIWLSVLLKQLTASLTLQRGQPWGIWKDVQRTSATFMWIPLLHHGWHHPRTRWPQLGRTCPVGINTKLWS